MSHISARIGEIRRQLGMLAPPVTVPATTAARTVAGTTSAGSFSSVLADEVAKTSVPAAAPTTTADSRAYVPGTPVPVVPAPTVTATATGTPAASVATPAVSATAGPSPVSPARRSPGSLTADGTPSELARYRNGRIPASALTSIGDGHRLWAPAAEAMRAMKAAATRDGVRIGVTDSYRSYDAQVDVARRKGLYRNGGLAAVPGTSDHGWGRSVDLDLDTSAQAWMRAHGEDYGFVEDTPREPWHWTYSPT